MTRKEAIWYANHVFNIVIERCLNAQNLKEAREFDEAKQIVIEALEQISLPHMVFGEETEKEPLLTPKEFAEKMNKFTNGADVEKNHIHADKLMCELLTNIGYGEGVEQFENMDKWYA